MAHSADANTATLADLPALLELEARFPGDRLSPRQFRYHLNRPGSILRTLRGDDRVVGYALTLLRGDSPAARLYSIAVHPEFRGQGLGRRLLRDAEAQAARRGARSLRLEVRADNAEAIALYRKDGYVEFSRRRAYYDDGMDALRLQRAIAAPESANVVLAPRTQLLV